MHVYNTTEQCSKVYEDYLWQLMPYGIFFVKKVVDFDNDEDRDLSRIASIHLSKQTFDNIAVNLGMVSHSFEHTFR